MILVDKDIKERVARNELIISEYQKANLNGVSYDLTLDKVLDKNGKEQQEYELEPGETVFIRTREKLSIPTDIVGRIAEKNSRMRQGLKVDGPHYQPGHVTYAFLRVQNMSIHKIRLESGMKIAQIMFEQLTRVPDVPYSAQNGASYQNEVSYVGLGNYKEEYERQTRKAVEKAKEDIEGISQRIYANVLTIMGILVAIFSMLTINYSAFQNATLDARYIMVMNLTLALCIVIMMGIIMIFVNKAKSKWFLVAYIVILIILAAATIAMSFCIF